MFISSQRLILKLHFSFIRILPIKTNMGFASFKFNLWAVKFQLDFFRTVKSICGKDFCIWLHFLLILNFPFEVLFKVHFEVKIDFLLLKTDFEHILWLFTSNPLKDLLFLLRIRFSYFRKQVFTPHSTVGTINAQIEFSQCKLEWVQQLGYWVELSKLWNLKWLKFYTALCLECYLEHLSTT